MRYSEMSGEQRKRILDNQDDYPLRVTFLNKVGLLTFEQVTFLRDHDVDFDVDDNQAAEILPGLQLQEQEPLFPGLPGGRVPTAYLVPVAAAILATLALLKKATKLLLSSRET